MNESNTTKWPAAIYFLASSLFLCGSVWYLWTGAINPEYYWQSSSAVATETPERMFKKNERILLTKGHGVRIDDVRIVYRGSHDGTILLDLYVLQLDPHFAYPHRIEEIQARKGFRMGDYVYQMLAASDGKISLKRL